MQAQFSNTMTNDQIADAVNEWVGNNPDRLDHLYDDACGFLAWKREAFARIEKSEHPVNDVLEKSATEAEAPYAAVEFSSNDEGNYMLVEAEDCNEAVAIAEKTLKFQRMSHDYLVDTEASYRVDAHDLFPSDRGKWRMFYLARD